MATNITGIEKPPLQFIITTAGNDYILVNAPKGWEKILVTQKRDNEYYAVKRTYTVPMDFVLDGAYLLREQYYQYGVQANGRLTINQLNPTTQEYDYQITVGDFDFSEFNDVKNIVTINLMDSGIESKIKAYHNVVYEFDMADGIDLELTPLVLEERADFITIQAPDSTVKYFNQLNIVNNPNLSITPSSKPVIYDQENTPDWPNSNMWFFRPTMNTDLRLQGYLDGALGGRKGTYVVAVKDNTGTSVAELYRKSHNNTGFESFHVEFDFSIPTYLGNRYYIYVDFGDDAGGFTAILAIGIGEIHATYNTISPASTAKAFRPKQLFDKLIEKMNGGVYPTQSMHLDTTWPQLTITSGDAIRGIENAKLKTSWDDFWQSINSVTNGSFGITNGIAVLEAKSNAFKRSLPIMNVGEVKEFELQPYTEIMASNINVGYEDINLDETGGRTIFNALQRYTTPLTRVQKTLDLVSKYGASDLEIELIRVQLNGRDSTDNSGDNKCFFVYVEATPVAGKYSPEGEDGYTSVTGVKAGSYNLKITPKQNLYRHGYYLTGILDKLTGGRLFFASATKDVNVVTVDLSGRRIAEGEDVNIQSLDAPLFLPHIVTFKCAVPPNQLLALQSAANGYIAFSYEGANYRGFIQSIGIDPARNSEQQFTVILTVDNDLVGLIK